MTTEELRARILEADETGADPFDDMDSQTIETAAELVMRAA